MFTHITTDPVIQQQYTPTILSNDPWIIQLDNFISVEECQTLITLCAELGYKRSEVSKKRSTIDLSSFCASCQDVMQELMTLKFSLTLFCFFL